MNKKCPGTFCPGTRYLFNLRNYSIPVISRSLTFSLSHSLSCVALHAKAPTATIWKNTTLRLQQNLPLWNYNSCMAISRHLYSVGVAVIGISLLSTRGSSVNSAWTAIYFTKTFTAREKKLKVQLHICERKRRCSYLFISARMAVGGI